MTLAYFKFRFLSPPYEHVGFDPSSIDPMLLLIALATCRT